MQNADAEERKAVLKEMLQLGVIESCVRFLKHWLCILQHLAANALGGLVEDSMGAQVSSSSTADVIEAVCIYALQQPDDVVGRLLGPDMTW